ncbi:MAG: collagen-like protein [Polyangiaceae bacterium]|nr:collagen-like protein [Polyangiaceae bacterium]
MFCPGDDFQIELVVTLDDGTTCSSADPSTGCRGKTNAVIAPEQVNIEATPGSFTDATRFVFKAPVDPLATAKDGVSLTGFIDLDGQRSKVARSRIAPVYDCQKERVFGAAAPSAPGAPGGPGPEVVVSVTSLSTPWFPNAALVRVESGGEKLYFISPSSDRPVRIVAKGQDGAMGTAGAAGAAGAPGAAATAICMNGGDGGPGLKGGPGGNGGDGGAGGRFRLVLDDSKGEALKGRVILEAPGGSAGAAGPGGPGGWGGKGGAPGAAEGPCAPPPPPNPADAPGAVPAPAPAPPAPGKDGAMGAPGDPGQPGKPGAAGPAPEVVLAARDKAFAAELEAIRVIESAPRAK